MFLKTLKYIFTISIIFHTLSLYAIGDGTLPVIRSIQIDNIDIPTQLRNLPDCIELNINKTINNNSFIDSTYIDTKSGLVQKLILANKNGTLELNVQLKLKDQLKNRISTKQIGQNEFIVNADLDNSSLRQRLILNDTSRACIKK